MDFLYYLYTRARRLVQNLKDSKMDEVSTESVGQGNVAQPTKRGVRYSTGLKAEVVAFLNTQLNAQGKPKRGAYKEAAATFGIPYLTAKAAYKKSLA